MALFGITTNNARMFGDPSQGGGTPIDETQFGDPSATPSNSYCKTARVGGKVNFTIHTPDLVSQIGKVYTGDLIYDLRLEITCNKGIDCRNCKEYAYRGGRGGISWFQTLGHGLIDITVPVGCCNCPGEYTFDVIQGSLPIKMIFPVRVHFDSLYTDSNNEKYIPKQLFLDTIEDFIQAEFKKGNFEDPCS